MSDCWAGHDFNITGQIFRWPYQGIYIICNIKNKQCINICLLGIFNFDGLRRPFEHLNISTYIYSSGTNKRKTLILNKAIKLF